MWNKIKTFGYAKSCSNRHTISVHFLYSNRFVREKRDSCANKLLWAKEEHNSNSTTKDKTFWFKNLNLFSLPHKSNKSVAERKKLLHRVHSKRSFVLECWFIKFLRYIFATCTEKWLWNKKNVILLNKIKITAFLRKTPQIGLFYSVTDFSKEIACLPSAIKLNKNYFEIFVSANFYFKNNIYSSLQRLRTW